MNRTIKFRGKRLDNGAWETGCAVVLWQGLEDDEWFIADKFTGYHTPVDRNTVGQFTGMKDKNGKEIYEGDILRTSISKNGIGFVRWNIENASFVVQMKNSAQWYNLWRGYEVIGSIHDDPGLLKGGTK